MVEAREKIVSWPQSQALRTYKKWKEVEKNRITETHTKSLRVAKPKKVLPQIFSPTNLNLESGGQGKKGTLATLLPLTSAGVWFGKHFYLCWLMFEVPGSFYYSSIRVSSDRMVRCVAHSTNCVVEQIASTLLSSFSWSNSQINIQQINKRKPPNLIAHIHMGTPHNTEPENSRTWEFQKQKVEMRHMWRCELRMRLQS